MQGTDRLRKHIEEKSAQRVSSILANAKMQSDRILEDAKAKAASIREEQELRKQKNLEIQKRQADAMKNLSQRRAELKKKQDLLDETLSIVEERLLAMDEKAKESLYLKWLSESKAETAEQIRISESDASWFTPILREKYSNLAILTDEMKGNGGFLLEKGRSIQDFRFDHLLEQNASQYQELAAKILFAEEKENRG